jgi:hypothetical protein
MPRGPAPDPTARRRNPPTIATTHLPAEGRPGRAPSLPKGYNDLDKIGRAWWNAAWKLPQATRWDEGSVYFVARRARLEDRLAALNVEMPTDQLEEVLLDAVGADGDEKRVRQAVDDLAAVICKLKALAGGEVSVMKEMRELDNRLGLNPKAMVDLRWTIADAPDEAEAVPDEVAQIADYRDRLG